MRLTILLVAAMAAALLMAGSVVLFSGLERGSWRFKEGLRRVRHDR